MSEIPGELVRGTKGQCVQLRGLGEKSRGLIQEVAERRMRGRGGGGGGIWQAQGRKQGSNGLPASAFLGLSHLPVGRDGGLGDRQVAQPPPASAPGSQQAFSPAAPRPPSDPIPGATFSLRRTLQRFPLGTCWPCVCGGHLFRAQDWVTCFDKLACVQEESRTENPTLRSPV